MLKIKKGYKLSNFELDIKKIGQKIYYWQKNKKNKKIINLQKFKLQADLKADILIKNCIKKYFIKPLILSEENKVNKVSQNFWLVDPIDGTRSFYDNYKGFVTQISYIHKRNPIYALIYAPALNKIWTAKLNSGAFLNKKKIIQSNKTRKQIRIT